MRSNAVRVVVGIGVLVVAVVLFVALRDDGDSGGSRGTSTVAKESPAAPEKREQETSTIVIKGGKPVGGVEELTFSEGDRIRFGVESDVADEIHVHGYDLTMDIEAGGSVSFDFPADIAGIFEVELEGSAVQIAEIRVNP